MATQKQLQLNIVKVDGPVFAGAVASVTVPGSEGEMTLLSDHTPLVSALRPGAILVKHLDGKIDQYETEGGTLEISQNIVTLLV